MRGKRARVLGERRGRWLLNFYPPFLFNRVRVLEIGPGFRLCRVSVRRSLLTRNLQGTTFGGTIFSAADPFYPVMYWQVFSRLGVVVHAWLRSAKIRYTKPARSALSLRFELTDEDVAQARDALERDGRYACWHTTEATDRDGAVCAVAETEVYLRVPGESQRGSSAF